jgi:hypothetical protein
MHSITSELNSIINQYLEGLRGVSEDKLSFKPGPGKWSKKEIIGHLIDSAQNNIRRFIVAQYEDIPYIVYDQDKWVAISDYQQYDTSRLILLWELINRHIVMILDNTPTDISQRNCQTQDLHTIEWLARDYIKHLLHHLHQVLELEPVSYP